MLMEEITTALVNHDSQSLIAKTSDGQTKPSTPPVFILCDRCYWCATYFDNRRIPTDNNCPQCNANSNQLTSFPIAPNESFTFDYNDKRGIEFEFKPRSR
jgi:predicted Zn-ribbon and HTH transcriptional regulator